MNILFYVTCTPNPLNGGIERVSTLLAEEFGKLGHNCYCIYFREEEPSFKSAVFKSQLCVPIDESMTDKVGNFISINSIDLVFNQLAYGSEVCDMFALLKKKYHFKLLTVHHNNPFYNKYTVIGNGNSPKSFLKKCVSYVFPNILLNRFNNFVRLLMLKNIKESDYYVVLSTKYLERIKNSFQIHSDKLKAISNPLTYKEFFDMNSYPEKEKIVLFVGRYDEYQKRVSRALKIWKAVEPYGYNDWKFVLVGHGNDMNYYKTLIEKNKIKNVELLGKHDPLSFYKRASIFLMTSAYEGWGMTIVEAMQNGCVPIVYDTFDAAKDIIRSNESGYVIKDGNSSEYCEKLRNLMCDDQRRKSMAQNAVSDMKRYTLDNIVKQWTELF